jgi:NitT/TauT family transport system substrate-binding protein
MKRLLVSALVLVVLLSAVIAPAGSVRAQEMTKVRLQLKWVAQAQFAGYFAAVAQGFYKNRGLDVEIKLGGPDIVPEQVVASGGAEFGLDWLPSLLNSREQGANLVHIAQVFARSGMREISFKDKNINSVADLKGKKVGVWLGGNEFELFAALVKNGMDPNNPSDVTIVKQPFDMTLMLKGEVDAAAAMTYNEYAQVLEAVNPQTNKQYQPDELNVIDFNKEGTAMLEDLVFANGDWLAKSGNDDVAVRFLAASFEGWAYCRDNQADCVKIVLSQGTALPEGHQTWQMNEINKLIWPNEKGIGILDPAAFKQTADISLKYKVITKEPDKDAYRTDLAEKALKLLGDKFDAFGKSWQAVTVKVSEGGKTAEVASASAPTGGKATLMVGSNDKLGKFLVGANGMTLYRFKKDKPGESACYDKCAEAWPPLLVGADENPAAGEGIAGKLGTITRKDGKLQVTYNDMPLYFYVKDKAAGDAVGQGVGDVWFVVAP